MFKRLICGGASRKEVTQSHVVRVQQARAGHAAKLCVVAGAALALPALWPFLSEQFGNPLQAQLALTPADLEASDDGSLAEASPLPLPDDAAGSANDEPNFMDDDEPLVAGQRDPLLGDEPVFADEQTAASDVPRFADDAVVNAHASNDRSIVRRVSVLSAEDVKNLVTRARLELAAGDLELAHRFAEAAAEVPIPVEYFKSRPKLVLDEIELHQQFRNADYNASESPKRDAPKSAAPLLSDDVETPAANDVTKVTPVAPAELPQATNAAPAEPLPPVVAVGSVEEPFDKDLLDGFPIPDEARPAPTTAATISGGDEPAFESPTAPPLPESNGAVASPVAPADVPIAEPEARGEAAVEPIVAVTTLAQESSSEVTPPVAPLTVKPLRPLERLAKAPRSFQALSQTKLSVEPRVKDPQAAAPKMPESAARKQMSQTPAIKHETGVGRNWGTLAYLWEAPGYYHSPLYFEEPGLERFGNEVPFVQPVLSAGSFLGNAATLPYQMWTEGNGPIACKYDMQEDRPGDCVPYSWQRLPLSATGALAETGTVLGLIFIIP